MAAAGGIGDDLLDGAAGDSGRNVLPGSADAAAREADEDFAPRRAGVEDVVESVGTDGQGRPGTRKKQLACVPSRSVGAAISNQCLPKPFVGPELMNTAPVLELSKIAEGSTGLTANSKPVNLGHCPELVAGLSPAWSRPFVRLTWMLPGVCTSKKSWNSGNEVNGDVYMYVVPPPVGSVAMPNPAPSMAVRNGGLGGDGGSWRIQLRLPSLMRLGSDCG